MRPWSLQHWIRFRHIVFKFILRWNPGSELDGMCEREWGRGYSAEDKWGKAEMSYAAGLTCDVWHQQIFCFFKSCHLIQGVADLLNIFLVIRVSPAAQRHIGLTDSCSHLMFLISSSDRGGGRRKGMELNGKQNTLCMTTPPLLLPASTPSPLTASHLHPFPSSFHFCHSLIFLLHKIRFDSKSPQACQMTDNPSQFYH